MTREIFGQNKILNHLDKVRNMEKDNLETLVVAELDMTNVCNSRCPQCAGRRTTNDELSIAQVNDYLTQFKGVGGKAVIFTGGGEPFCNKSTSYAIKLARQIGLDVGVITNGVSLTEQSINSILKYATWCRISLDAGDTDTYKKVHGTNHFNKVCDNIIRLVQKKKEIESKCTIGTAYLTNGETIFGARRFISASRQLGVDYAQLRPFHGDYTYHPKLFKQFKEMTTDNFKVVLSEQKYQRFCDEVKRPYNKCTSGYFATTITADGKVYWCCHTRGIPEYCIGDLKKERLEDIFIDKEKLRKMEDRIKEGICPYFCRGDEMNRTINEIRRPKEHVNFL